MATQTDLDERVFDLLDLIHTIPKFATQETETQIDPPIKPDDEVVMDQSTFNVKEESKLEHALPSRSLAERNLPRLTAGDQA